MLSSFLKSLSQTYLRMQSPEEGIETSRKVSAVSGFILGLVHQDQVLLDHLASELITTSLDAGDDLGIRRAIVAVISNDKTRLGTLLEKAIDQFGDKLFIKHAPILQQQGM